MSKFSTWLNSLTADGSPDAAADYLVTYDASAATSKKVLLSVLASVLSAVGIPSDGWVAAGETWTYASADDPTYTFTISGDKTAKYQAGMRIKWTQTTVRYAIITKVAYSAPNTTITLYGGADYDLDNAAISNPYYSPVKCPFGFPMDPAKWTVEYTDTSLRTQATPTTDTWYNINTAKLDIPIGAWRVSYKVAAHPSDSGSTGWLCQTTLSTANNSASDADFTTYFYAGPHTDYIDTHYVEKHVTLTSKTSYYLNTLVTNAGLDNLYNRNDKAKLFIRAVCAYL